MPKKEYPQISPMAEKINKELAGVGPTDIPVTPPIITRRETPIERQRREEMEQRARLNGPLG